MTVRIVCDRMAWLMPAALVPAVAAAALVAAEHGGLVAFLLWTLAVVAVAAPGAGRLRLRLDAGDAGVLLGLLVVSTGFRTFRLATIPAGMWVDELSTAVNALHVWAGRFAPFGTTPLMPDGAGWVHTSNLYLYAMAPLVRMAGGGLLGVKAMSVVPAVLAAPLCFVLARRWAGRTAATLAGGLLAVGHWHVVVSRWGWDEVLLTTLVIAAFVALAVAVERDDARIAGLAGVLFGLALFTYVAARLAIAAAVAAVILHAVQRRSREAARPVYGLFLGVAATAAPLVAVWLAHPTVFSARTAQLSILGRVLHGEPGLLLTTLVDYLAMFSIHGDPNPRHNLPGVPLLGVAWGILFLVGLILAHAGWRRDRDRILLLWFWAGLAGGILSDPASAPNSYRVGLIAPACALLAALAFETLTARWARRPALRVTLVAVILALTGLRTATAYFVTRPADLACWWANKDGAATEVVVDRIRGVSARGATCLVDDSLMWTTMRLRLDLARLCRDEPLARSVLVSTTRDGLPDLAHRVLLIAPDRWRQLGAATDRFSVQPLANPFGQAVALAVAADPDVLGTAPAATRSGSAASQRVERDPGQSMEQRGDRGGPGQRVARPAG